jgi:hypothetical protein
MPSRNLPISAPLDEEGAIISNLDIRIGADPLGAKTLSGIAEDGVRSLRAELRRLRGSS